MLKKIFGTYSDREVKRIKNKFIKKINKLEGEISKLSDDELKAKTNEFKERLGNNETVDDLLVEAFAVCREASKRVLGMRPYDVQLIGGIILHQGRIAEMKTGEGKTLVATLPAYLNALTGKGVHIVTVNDYLAQRDRDTMKPLYDFLGIQSEVIVSTTPQELRKELYKADLVYITNNELGFDYLKDNMVMNINDKVQRELNFAVVDEVDSILIDEARTPLIISAPGEKPTHMYSMVDVFCKSLTKDDYEKDEKLNTVHLTEQGVTKAEKIFGIENYADIKNNTLVHHIGQGLKANYGMKLDKDYIVSNNEILIIDEFTGRIAEGRRFSNGLHQAIEAKEGVPVQAESLTLATITYQNFFKLYGKLSGMTGTAETEMEEFTTTYGLDVVVIPTNKPIARIDNKDKLYFTEKAKYIAIVKEIIKNHATGRPILVGTPNISKSELLSDMLTIKGIPHSVLNAKNHEKEAEIIANAGQIGAVTIATNMAGRGTDIKLGDGVAELGGLMVIGAERAENRRVDNQLRGRSGRQGDNGTSQFYLSLEDELAVFATDRVKSLMDSSDKDDTNSIDNRFLNKSIDYCQRRIEGQYFEMRKNTLQYDDVVNTQRKIIYAQRDKVLLSENLQVDLEDILSIVFNQLVDIVSSDDEIDIDELIKILEPEYFNTGFLDKDKLKTLNEEELKDYLISIGKKNIEEKVAFLGENFTPIARNILLRIVDTKWMEQIDALNDFKKEVKLISYKGEDPIHTYIKGSHEMYKEMIFNIQSETIKYILKLTLFDGSTPLINPALDNAEKLIL